MRPLMTLALLAFAVGALGQKTMSGMVPPRSKEAWQKDYTAAAKLLQDKQFDKLLKFFAPNFTEVEGGKTSNLAQFKADLVGSLKDVKNLKVAFKVLSVVNRPNEVVVTNSGVISCVAGLDPKKKPVKLVEKGTYTDTWRNVGGSWKMVRMVGNPTLTADGKPVRMQKPPRSSALRSAG